MDRYPGHGPGQQILQTGNETVNIPQVEAAGAYAFKLHFVDGHNTALFPSESLYYLRTHQVRPLQPYLPDFPTALSERKQHA